MSGNSWGSEGSLAVPGSPWTQDPPFLCPLVTEPRVPVRDKLNSELTSQHISLHKLHIFVPPGEDRTSPIHHLQQSREDVAAVPNCCSGNGVCVSATAPGVEMHKNQPLPCPFATCKGSSEGFLLLPNFCCSSVLKLETIMARDC